MNLDSSGVGVSICLNRRHYTAHVGGFRLHNSQRVSKDTELERDALLEMASNNAQSKNFPQ